MTYIVKRRNRLYVVAYDGIDPLTGKERRRWHPAGTDRAEAEQIARRIHAHAESRNGPTSETFTLGVFLTATWLPRKRLTVRPTTAYRYAWIIHHYVIPAIGDVPLRLLRPEHLDATYAGSSHQAAAKGAPLPRKPCTKSTSSSAMPSTTRNNASSSTATAPGPLTLPNRRRWTDPDHVRGPLRSSQGSSNWPEATASTPRCISPR